MKKFCLFFLFALSANCYAVQQPDTIATIAKLPPEGLTLDKGWKFHAGDDIKWAGTDFDDAKWDTIHPEKDVYFLPQVRKAGICWFRLKLHIDSSLFNKTFAMIVQQSGASEIYLNGKRIYTLGKVGTGPDNNSIRLIGKPLAFKLDQGP